MREGGRVDAEQLSPALFNTGTHYKAVESGLSFLIPSMYIRLTS